jgi:ubiquinone/menaquinone biosynthesis C-methylase UbiE
VGGGDSYLSDHLLKSGFTDLTVLDISGAALKRARERHGGGAGKICWVESDVLEFSPDREYNLWHDRATFHFLTESSQIERYLEVARLGIRPGGYLILGTFSDQGPATCSGLPVQRYAIPELEETVAPWFKKIRGVSLNHHTPSGGVQDYTFCLFQRLDGKPSL